MRILILSAFFFICFIYFRKEEVPLYNDAVTTRASSSKKLLQAENKNDKMIASLPDSDPSAEIVSSSESEEKNDEEVDEYAGEVIEPGIPWTEIEDGWREELKLLLTELDAENAETMLAAYLEETKKYGAKVGLSNTPEGAVTEGDESEEVTEFQHTENLKEIFGPYYGQVKSLHEQYVNSVQYLNNSTHQISFGL